MRASVEFHQLRRGGQIPVGARRADMSEVGGQRGDVLVDVDTGSLPFDQGVYGEAVSQIVIVPMSAQSRPTPYVRHDAAVGRGPLYAGVEMVAAQQLYADPGRVRRLDSRAGRLRGEQPARAAGARETSRGRWERRAVSSLAAALVGHHKANSVANIDRYFLACGLFLLLHRRLRVSDLLACGSRLH